MSDRTYGLCELLTKMGWSFTRIDQETQDGTIEMVRRGGKTGYRLHKQFPISAPKPSNNGMSKSEVGRFVNRKG